MFLKLQLHSKYQEIRWLGNICVVSSQTVGTKHTHAQKNQHNGSHRCLPGFNLCVRNWTTVGLDRSGCCEEVLLISLGRSENYVSQHTARVGSNHSWWSNWWLSFTSFVVSHARLLTSRVFLYSSFLKTKLSPPGLLVNGSQMIQWIQSHQIWQRYFLSAKFRHVLCDIAVTYCIISQSQSGLPLHKIERKINTLLYQIIFLNLILYPKKNSGPWTNVTVVFSGIAKSHTTMLKALICLLWFVRFHISKKDFFSGFVWETIQLLKRQQTSSFTS